MPKVPEYFATEQIETSQMPRAPMEIADVGAGMDAVALARFGGALKDFGLDRLQQIINIETQSQYTAGKAAWQKGETEFLIELENDQDFDGYDKKYKAKVKELRGQILTKELTSDAKAALNDYIETQRAALGKKVVGQYLRKERDYARASTYEAVRIFEMAGEAGKAKAALIEGRNAGYLGAEETSKRIAQVEDNVAIHQRQKILNNAYQAAKSMPYKEAISFLNDLEGLTSAERNDLIRRRERQEEIATATTNRKVRWDTIIEIGKDPESITDDYLESLVKPNSLTWDDAEEMRKIRDTDNHPLKRTDFQRGLTTLEEIKDIRISMLKKDDATAEELREELLLQFQLKNDLEQWIIEKDRTTEEIEKKVMSLTEPIVEEATRTYLDMYLGFWGGYYRYISGYEAYKRIREKLKPKEGEEDLTILTDEELEAIIRGK